MRTLVSHRLGLLGVVLAAAGCVDGRQYGPPKEPATLVLPEPPPEKKSPVAGGAGMGEGKQQN